MGLEESCVFIDTITNLKEDEVYRHIKRNHIPNYWAKVDIEINFYPRMNRSILRIIQETFKNG